jgi:glycosyltransferase involved in cell wall biosynthesis
MKLLNIYYHIASFFQNRILKKRIVFDQYRENNGSLNALLYYKIEPFVNPLSIKNYHHTNNREILEIVKILNKLGFNVDIIDRNAEVKDFKKLKKHYHLFIGLGAGNSGKNFKKLAEKYPKALKLLYAAGPEPELSNQLIIERYEYFSERHNGKQLSYRRMITEFKFDEFAGVSDAFIVIGNIFTIESYKKYQKPIYPIFPSSSPKIKFKQTIDPKQQTKFLYFGGNGNLVKGLDLLIEVFHQLPELELHICAPTNETDFYTFYDSMLKASPNIAFHGFITPGEKKYNELAELCGFVILPSCSEGMATSVTTCMRSGLIPVVTYEAGIDTGDFGFLLENYRTEYLSEKLKHISKISFEEFTIRAQKTFRESEKFTISGFELTFNEAIKQSLQDFSINI